MLGYNPVVEGLQIGQVVELADSTAFPGEHGQLQEYLPETNQFRVLLISSGELVTADAKSVFTVIDCNGPGDGGPPESFDVVIGPQTDRGALGDSITECLTQKGFCTVKIIQRTDDLQSNFAELKELEEAGKFGRLAEETEEGYLGRGGRAKVMWLDPDSDALSPESLAQRNDGNLSTIAELLLPYSENALGKPITERTPALLCMSMSDLEEAEYESPVAGERDIEDFYSTWMRGILRVVHFMGPGTGKVTLNLKNGAPINNLEDSYEISAPANTLLLVREDAFEYSYEEPRNAEASWLLAFFLKPGPQWSLGELDGDTALLAAVAEGPPGPTQDLVAVNGLSIQACGMMTDHHKESAAYIAGVDGQLEMPFARFEYLPYYNDEVDLPMGTTYVKHFAVQEGVELFDNRAFEISNMEAQAMDPLCRQVMEVGYLSIFQLGYTKKWCNTHPTHASVSVGCDKQEWLSMPDVPRNVATNNQLAICANRFNYVFNLKGGSYLCDTACSSSLIAGHLGKVNLLERRWDPLEFHLGMGAGVTLSVGSFIGSCASHMLSPGGRCFTFNATANGYNRGDGTAAMAIQAGTYDDLRWAYMRGTQIGQDGRSASMSAPNGPAQEKCIRSVLEELRMDPPEIDSFECHGTGTALGDPIEVGAFKRLYNRTKRDTAVLATSSKTNLGHTEGGAGIAGFLKCMLMCLHSESSPNIHLRELNPHLDYEGFPCFFISEGCTMTADSCYAGVSSFGVSGTNGHCMAYSKNALTSRGLVNQNYNRTMLGKVKDGKPNCLTQGEYTDWANMGRPSQDEPGTEYQVEALKDGSVVWRPLERQPLRKPEGPFYLKGSFNEWAMEQMSVDGVVIGLHTHELEIGESGEESFQIAYGLDDKMMFYPEETQCTRKTARIQGPEEAPSEEHAWLIRGTPGTYFRIEFFVFESGARQSVNWMAVKD